MHFKNDPPRPRDAPESIPIAGRSFAFACGLSDEELHALQEEVRARGGRVDADLNPDTDVLVVGGLPGVGRLAEKGREVILRGELYRDRRGLLEFVTEAALRVALAASRGASTPTLSRERRRESAAHTIEFERICRPSANEARASVIASCEQSMGEDECRHQSEGAILMARFDQSSREKDRCHGRGMAVDPLGPSCGHLRDHRKR